METEEVQKLIAYFIIYSFLGWVLESIYKTIMQKKFVNSGFLYGPICPIYGIGAIIMLLFLNSFSEHIFILFLVGMFAFTVWEYLVGWGLEKIFKIKYWDYSENRYNFQGRVCLSHSMAWGILGVLFIVLIHPQIKNILNNISSEILLAICIIGTAYMLIDFIVSIIKIKNITVKIKILKEITITIKEKTEELKNLIENNSMKKKYSNKLKETIGELNKKQQELREKIEKQTSRLRKAFPTMHLKEFGAAINKRIKELKGEK